MDTLISLNRYTHIVFGFAGLAAWWIPILSAKGGQRHVRFGKVFALCAYVVGGSAIASVTMRLSLALWQGVDFAANRDNFAFLILLAYLGILTIGITHFAVRTIRTKKNPSEMRTPLMLGVTYAMMAGSAFVTAWALAIWSSVSIILLLLAPAGLLGGRDILRYVNRGSEEERGWWYQHMGAMLGAGIAFHTAFLVFGSRVVLDLSILGPLNWVPWIAPAVIGTIAGRYWENFYRRKFGDLPGGGEAARQAPR